jgi:hypothetical protein
MIRPGLLVSLVLLMTACATPPAARMGSVGPGIGDMEVQLVGYPDCPNMPAMRRSLRGALAELGGGLMFREVDQNALEAEDARRCWPSPTVLVNGQDLFGMDRPSGPAEVCRFYEGRAPGAQDIARRLRLAALK